MKLEKCPYCGGKITLYSHTVLGDNYNCFARCGGCKTEFPMPEAYLAASGVRIYPSSIRKAERFWNQKAAAIRNHMKEATND